MINVESLLYRFQRALMDTKKTFVFQKCNLEEREMILRFLPSNLMADDVLVVSYLDEKNWIIIHKTGVSTSNDKRRSNFDFCEIAEAKIDLRKNRDLGFDSARGLRWLTLILKSGVIDDIEFESGSAAIASSTLICSLLRA